jgi:hypothetical protein
MRCSTRFSSFHDFVLVHGLANAMGELDVNEAHRKLLGDIALSPMIYRRSHSASPKRFSSNILAN